MLKKLKVVIPAAAATVAVASQAMAASIVDYSTIGSSITEELSPAITAVLPIAGTLLAVGIGWKFVKRFAK